MLPNESRNWISFSLLLQFIYLLVWLVYDDDDNDEKKKIKNQSSHNEFVLWSYITGFFIFVSSFIFGQMNKMNRFCLFVCLSVYFHSNNNNNKCFFWEKERLLFYFLLSCFFKSDHKPIIIVFVFVFVFVYNHCMDIGMFLLLLQILYFMKISWYTFMVDEEMMSWYYQCTKQCCLIYIQMDFCWRYMDWVPFIFIFCLKSWCVFGSLHCGQYRWMFFHCFFLSMMLLLLIIWFIWFEKCFFFISRSVFACLE